MRHLNDYEIIEQVQSGCEASMELLIQKYERFMASIIHHFNLAYQFEDLMQDSKMILMYSVRMFDPSFNKTFTRFLELNIRRHMMSTIRSFRRYAETVYDHGKEVSRNLRCQEMPGPYHDIRLAEIKKLLTPQEFKIYTMRILKNASIELICQTTGFDCKSIYGILDRAKRKIKAYYGV
jgi:RNA polymerase sigma factor (sigma-70 family)